MTDNTDTEEENDDCPACQGTGMGMYWQSSCWECNGSGVRKTEEEPDDYNPFEEVER